MMIRALECARKEKKSTLQPKHIMQAIEIAGFDEMTPELELVLSRIFFIESWL